MLSEKDLAAIRERNDLEHGLDIGHISVSAALRMRDDRYMLLAHIDAIEGGGTLKLLREAQRRIEEQDKRISALMRAIGDAGSFVAGAKSHLRTEPNKTYLELDYAFRTLCAPVANGEE